MIEPREASKNLSRGAATSFTLSSRLLVATLSLAALGIASLSYHYNKVETARESLEQAREVLIPTARLLDQSRLELELQLQRLELLGPVMVQSDSKLLHLSPGFRALLGFNSSPLLPSRVREIFDPWLSSAREYEAARLHYTQVSQALSPLRDLREKTLRLRRVLDQELTFDLQENVQQQQWAWLLSLGAFVLGFGIILAANLLLSRWMAPLKRLSEWLPQADPAANVQANPSQVKPLIAPTLLPTTGLRRAPKEIHVLYQAFRIHVAKLNDQNQQLQLRSERNTEMEKAMGSLFSALVYLTRHNQELMGELIKRERLASMGEMAARLAHEIRNPLNSLNLKLELLREDLKGPQRQALDGVLGEIDRLDALTESHLRVARNQMAPGTTTEFVRSDAATHTHLGPVLSQSLELLQLDFAALNIACEWVSELAPEASAPVPANVLRAALLNLLKNAKEAIEENLLAQPQAPRRLRVELSPGPLVQGWEMRILDSGCGFRDEQLEQPMESFRTTKVQGSGLGLVTTQRMLDAYGVHIQLQRVREGDFVSQVTLRGPLVPPPLHPNQVKPVHELQSPPAIQAQGTESPQL